MMVKDALAVCATDFPGLRYGAALFVNGETAEMVSLSPANILNLVKRLLQDPFRFFSKKKEYPRQETHLVFACHPTENYKS